MENLAGVVVGEMANYLTGRNQRASGLLNA